MTLNQLSYFVEIVKQCSFTKAADKLFVSQSTLSKSIRTLEEEFQVELINRSAKEFALTQEGHIFHEYAERILNFYQEQTQELFQRLNSASGTLRLGVPPTSGTIYFYSVLNKFQKKSPGIDLQIEEITSKHIQDQVLSGKLDMGAIIEPFYDIRLHKQPVFKSEAVLLVPVGHPLADRESVTFEEIKEESIIMISQDYMYHDVVVQKFKEAGITPKIVFESYQWEWIYEMVADGQGVSILPKPLVEKFNNESRVRLIHLTEPEFPWTLSLIYRKDKFVTIPMQCFLDVCMFE